MLNLKKLRESKGIKVSPMRMNLSEIISESYNLMYDEPESNLRSLIESHIVDVRENPTDVDRLSENLRILKTLHKNKIKVTKSDLSLCESKNRKTMNEDEDLDDPRLETDDATVDPMTAVNVDPEAEPEHDAPQADPDEVEKFAENSRGKTFYKALTRATSLKESVKRFNLSESLQMYKAANSAMTQMAIEYEHNESFKETFNVLTTVLGRATSKLIESIRASKPVPKKVYETISKFATALREDDQDDINDFVDWVDSEYSDEDVCPECGQSPCVCDTTIDSDVIEIPDDITPEQLADAVIDIVQDIYNELPVTTDDDGETVTAEEELEDITAEEAEDLRQYLNVIRGSEDTEETDEPTEEELDALEERLRIRRSMKDNKRVPMKRSSRKKESKKNRSHRKNEEYSSVRDLIYDGIELENIPSISEALGSDFENLLVCSEEMLPNFESFERSLISRSEKIKDLDTPRGVAATLYSLSGKLWVAVAEYGHYSLYTTRDNASMLESRKREASDPLTTGTEGEEVDADDEPIENVNKEPDTVLEAIKSRINKRIKK